jgi:prepilin-type N-terminal cleavage/methylation domain-containing protein
MMRRITRGHGGEYPVKRRGASDEGMTLIELLVAMTLLMLVLSAAYMAAQASNKAANAMDARQRASEQNRTTMERLTREMRQAIEITDGSGVFKSVGGRSCEFYSDVTKDNVPDLVSYRVYGGQFLRKVTRSTTSVPPYSFTIQDPEVPVVLTIDPAYTGDVFTYWDNQDPPVQVTGANIADISAISIRIVAKTSVGREAAVIDLSTWVKVRSVHNTID